MRIQARTLGICFLAVLPLGCGTETTDPGETRGGDVEILAPGEGGCDAGGFRVTNGDSSETYCDRSGDGDGDESLVGDGDGDGAGNGGTPGDGDLSGDGGTTGDGDVSGSGGTTGDGDGDTIGVGGTAPVPECVWCTPGSSVPSCAPDGVTRQACVDDGDGCGHWEAVQVCDVACAFAYAADEPDALGNQGTLTSRCFEENECSPWRPCPAGASCVNGECSATPDPESCLTAVPCGSGEKCNVTLDVCEPTTDWMLASAALYTAFDGLTHRFDALGENLIVSGCANGGEDYWNATEVGCTTVLLGPNNWGPSDQGPEYSGQALSAGYLPSLVGISAPGTYDLGCGSFLVMPGDRFETQNPACSVTISSIDLAIGGHIQGTFEGTAEVRGHDETTFDSTLTVSGSFRVAVD